MKGFMSRKRQKTHAQRSLLSIQTPPPAVARPQNYVQGQNMGWIDAPDKSLGSSKVKDCLASKTERRRQHDVNVWWACKQELIRHASRAQIEGMSKTSEVVFSAPQLVRARCRYVISPWTLSLKFTRAR
jgi:hypothetical protein